MSQPEPFVVRRGAAQLHGDRWPAMSGTRDPARVVFLHSGVTDRRSWADVIPLLTESSTVIAYDRNGFGDTLFVDEPSSDLEDLAAVLDETTQGPVWLVGNSAGGGLALDFTLAHPQRVTGLVLLAPAVSGAPEPDELDAPTKAIADLLDVALEAKDLDAANRLEARLWLDGPSAPEGRVGGQGRQLFLTMNAIALQSEAEATANAEAEHAARPPAWPRLADITVPALVACGDLDVPFILDQSRALAAALPNGRFELLTGRGHLPSLEDPAQVGALVLAGLAT
jgi:pimeloyl-ACP methyl ester carboxylesterase